MAGKFLTNYDDERWKMLRDIGVKDAPVTVETGCCLDLSADI